MTDIAPQKKRGFITPLAEVISTKFPDLKRKLKTADMNDNPVEFLGRIVTAAGAISLGILLLVYIFVFETIKYSIQTENLLVAVFWIVAPIMIVPMAVFFYLMLYPEAMTMRRQKEMDYEIVFAGRHIIIALKSGMPLFDTFVGTSNGYGAVSREFAKIVDQVVLGVPIAQAIKDTAQYNPSKYFTRVMMQMANALSSGADVGDSLESVLEQISKEQLISLKEYSQKLTPVVMFYMVFGIVVPSLGVVLATVILSAISGGKFGFSSSILILVFMLIAIIQFLFLGFIESSRPKYLI